MLLFINTSFALEYQSARTTSLAGGGRAGCLLTDTVTLNPSMLGFYQISALSGTLNWTTPGAGRSLYNLSVIDGNNQWFSAGLGFTRALKGDFIRLAVSKKIDYWLSVGAHAKRFNLRAKELPPGLESFTAFDGGASVTFGIPKEWLPSPLILISLTSDNLHHAQSVEKYFGPKEYGISTKVNINDLLLLYGDFIEHISYFNGGYPMYHGSAEISLGSEFFIRGGMFGFRSTGWSLGGGWVGPKVGLNYGFQNRTSDPREKLQTLTLDLYM